MAQSHESHPVAQGARFAQKALDQMPKRHPTGVLLQRANTFAFRRYGITISDRQLERLVYVGVIPGPEPFGQKRGVPPKWLWSPLSYRRILQYCRMRKHGFTRTTAIMLHLWLGGAEYPFSSVRSAAVKEFRRLRKAVARPVPAGWDPRVEGEELSPRSYVAILKGLGSEETVFPTLSPEAILLLAGSMFFGVEPGQDTMFMLLSQYGVPKLLIEELKQQDTAVDDLELGKRTFAGLAADPEGCEISAEASLAEADKETFINIRDFARVAPWMYGMVPILVSIMYPQADNAGTPLGDGLAKANLMLQDPSFRLLPFVFMVRRAQLKGDHGRGAGVFSRAFLRPFRELVLFISSNEESQAMLREAITRLGIEPEALLSGELSVPPIERADPGLRTIARKFIRITWRHGLSDLLKLRKPIRPTV